MTRKDYKAIAHIVDMATIVDNAPLNAKVVSKISLVIALCNLFAKDIPNFKDDVFVKACEGEKVIVKACNGEEK